MAGRKFRLPRIRLSLAWVVTLVVASTILSISLLCLRMVYDQKRLDSEAIVFLQLERQAGRVATFVGRLVAGKSPDSADLSFSVVDGFMVPLKGDVKAKLGAADAGLDLAAARQDPVVLSIAGRAYAGRLRAGEGPSPILDLWRINFPALGGWPRKGEATQAYMINRSGQPVFATVNGLTAAGVLKNELVQRFIGLPTRQGQLTFENSEHKRVSGFYQEVEGTNLVLFVESTANPAWLSMVGALRTVVFAGALIILVGAAFLQWSLSTHGKRLRVFSAEVERAIARPEVTAVDDPGLADLNTLVSAVNVLLNLRSDAVSPRTDFPEPEPAPASGEAAS